MKQMGNKMLSDAKIASFNLHPGKMVLQGSILVAPKLKESRTLSLNIPENESLHSSQPLPASPYDLARVSHHAMSPWLSKKILIFPFYQTSASLVISGQGGSRPLQVSGTLKAPMCISSFFQATTQFLCSLLPLALVQPL